MKREIEKHMSTVSLSETGAAAEFIFPDTFKGFQGHFPGNPIVPGVCLIQCALVLAEEALGKSLEVKMIKNAKFVATISPMQPVRLECTFNERKIVGAEFTSDGNRIASLKLVVKDA